MLPTSETQLAAPPVSQPVQDKTIDVIKIEDEPEDVIRPCTDSTRSSDVELNTEDETDDYAYADIDENEIDEHSEVRGLFGLKKKRRVSSSVFQGQKKQRENVIRCKIYRDKKKQEQLDGERQLEKLLGIN